MKICFLARPTFDRFSTALYQNLRTKHKDIEAVFITTNKKETAYVKTEIPNAVVYETSTYIRKEWGNFTKESLVKYEETYNCAPIWKYIYADRFLIYRKYDDAIRITAALFSFFENIFSDGSVDFYYSEAIATLQCYVAYIVGKKYGVKYVSQMCARGNIDTSYHYFINDEFMHNACFDNNYLQNKYSDEERKKAEEYLYDFENYDSPPPSARNVQSIPKINGKALIGPVKRMITFFDPDLNDPYSYMYYKGYKNYTKQLKFWYRYQKIKKYYHKADYNEKYVYFPLHYQPEASTCVCAEKYEKQLFFIDSWAKSLPADTVLYLKEHYAGLGHRDLFFYEELKKYPNVILISPFESSRKLIENAYAVTTLTGTAGFEAMLLRKPVILGGSIVFDNAPGIIKVDDIYDNYLKCMQEWKKPSREDIIQYLCECFRSYSVGNAYTQNHYDLIYENIDNLGDSLYKYLKSRKE